VTGRLAITGGRGFLGWHAACRLRAVHRVDAERWGRAEFADIDLLARRLSGVDTVIHLAGVNRADSDELVEQGNVSLARTLAAALHRLGRPVHLVYANSVQSSGTSAYGRGKATAGGLLRAAVTRCGGTMADVVLPNLFGEHGRPAYNSFVATFCHEVAAGRRPEVTDDREIPLLHAQAAAQELIEAAVARTDGVVSPSGEPRRISDVLAQLTTFHELYAGHGELPPLTEPFAVSLFNTYRSYLFPARFPVSAEVHADERGRLFETIRSHGGTGQAFVSTTVPGATRGDHYHLRKVERFFVVRGEAEIALRRLLHNDVVRFRLSGDRPSFVDMPTMWVHNITNVGDSDLVTMFWADQLLDPEHPDQFPEQVEPTQEAAR